MVCDYVCRAFLPYLHVPPRSDSIGEIFNHLVGPPQLVRTVNAVDPSED